MTDIIADAISQGVDLLVTAVILSAIVSMLSTATTVNAKVNEQQAMNQQLVEWREHNQYNGTVVYAQDVMSAILEFRGNPYVRVTFTDIPAPNNVVLWRVGVTDSSEYTYTKVAAKLSSTYMYKAELDIDDTGVVVGYNFTASKPTTIPH